MIRYEIATFAFPIGAAARALPRLGTYMNGAGHGSLRACWISAIGCLNEIMPIREFGDDGERLAERELVNTVRNAILVAAPFSPLS